MTRRVQSLFDRRRSMYQPKLPKIVQDLSRSCISFAEPSDHSLMSGLTANEHLKELAGRFPKTIGQKPLRFAEAPLRVDRISEPVFAVVLSGGQAPGGHNVICGIFDGLMQRVPKAKLYGFLNGPRGLVRDEKILITADLISQYRNTGGFDMLGTSRTKIETPEQFAKTEAHLLNLGVSGLIIIGGDDSNTNAALLAEYFAEKSQISVVGVPKTIDGDLKNTFVETTFGFDTAVKLYAELVSNVARDCLSSRKYYHFIRLMGRAASHITLETALLTRPNLALISEESRDRGMTLERITQKLAGLVLERSEQGKDFGLILVPEGLIEFLPDFKVLIEQLNAFLSGKEKDCYNDCSWDERLQICLQALTPEAAQLLMTVPLEIQKQLLMERDPHGNVQLSQIETEKLLIDCVEKKLQEWAKQGKYKGKFSTQRHFFGYEGRCAAPTNFDADYAYCLGKTACGLVLEGKNGYMAVVQRLATDRESWDPIAIPLVNMMNFELRNGKLKPVIEKGLVDIQGPTFKKFKLIRNEWEREECYHFSGPIQYFGPSDLTDICPLSLRIEQNIEVQD